MASADGDRSGPALTIGSTAMFGLIGSLANVVLAVVRSKVTATTIGPEGLGKAAEINQIVGLANVATTAMTGVLLVNQLGQARGAADADGVKRIVSGAWSSALIVSAVAGLASVVAAHFVLPLPWGPAAWPLTALAALGTVFASGSAVYERSLVVFERFDRWMMLSIGSNVLQTALMAAALLMFGLGGYFTATAAAAALVVPMWFRATSRYVPAVPARPSFRLDRDYMAKSLRFGATSLVSNGFSQVQLTVVRWLLERQGGPVLNGQFQAAAAVGNQYFMMVLHSLGGFAFPRYAAARTPEELATEVKNTAAFMLRLTPPLIFFGIAFRDVVIRTFYSQSFMGASDLLGWQMAGDVARAVAWAVAGPLFVRGRLRAYLLSEGIGLVLNVSLSLLLIPRYGLIGAGYAQLVMSVVSGFAMMAILRASCQVDVSYRLVLVTLPITALGIGAVLATNRWPAARWVVAAVGAVWAERTGLVASAWARVRDKLRPLLGRAG
jgi:PST family polysaccharide transporter